MGDSGQGSGYGNGGGGRKQEIRVNANEKFMLCWEAIFGMLNNVKSIN